MTGLPREAQVHCAIGHGRFHITPTFERRVAAGASIAVGSRVSLRGAASANVGVPERCGHITSTSAAIKAYDSTIGSSWVFTGIDASIAPRSGDSGVPTYQPAGPDGARAVAVVSNAAGQGTKLSTIQTACNGSLIVG